MNKIEDIRYRTRLFRRSARFWWQRRTRGWDDSETWDLGNTTFTRWILPRLKLFRKSAFSHPSAMTKETWEDILDQMIEGFEIVALDKVVLTDEEEEKVDKSYYLFWEWGSSLWN